MGYNANTVMLLRKLRKGMGSDLYFYDAKRIFNENIDFLERGDMTRESARKLKLAKKRVSMFIISNIVKFIAVTGSTAAGTARKEDDIDVFIVVKNGMSWIYRGLLLLKNLGNRRIRFAGQKDVRDVFCPNMIYEERGLDFKNDIFNFHELYFLKPIYMEEYLNTILRRNSWVMQFGGYVEKNNVITNKRNLHLEIFNLICFMSQVAYMKLCGHKPDLRRLWVNYKRGKIEFFPVDFKDGILGNLDSV